MFATEYCAASVILWPILFVLPVLSFVWNRRLFRALLAVAAWCAIRGACHSEALCTTGISPDCARKQYPDYLEKRNAADA